MTDDKLKDHARTTRTERAGARSRGSRPGARPTGVNRVADLLLKWTANLVFVGLTIFLTSFFTIFFSSPPPAHTAQPTTASDQAALKKIEELRAKDQELLTTYGTVNPQTKMLRVPIDRAMELVIADVGKPVPPRPPAPVAGVATAPGAPAAAAPGGMTPSQLYQAVCIACHDVDGKGSKVRIAMPAIPDFTDPKFQASRTEAELEHSIMDGKGTLMLPMKDKLALAHIDVKDMVAFMRAFQTGKPVMGAAPAGALAPAAAGVAPAPAGGPPAAPSGAAPAVPAAPASAEMTPIQLYQSVCIACHDGDGKGSKVRIAMPAIPDLTDPKFQASRTEAELEHSILNGKGTLMLPMKDKLALAHIDVKAMVAFMRAFQSGKQVVAAAPAVSAGAPGAQAPSPVTGVPAFSPLATASTASPATSAKARAGSAIFMMNCIPCHGPDGRGTAVRPAMPVIPDFTNREWQTSHQTAQLSLSILEGKGTLMPAWRGRVSPVQAGELIAFIRTFGPPDLALNESSQGSFEERFRQLQKQWQELDRQAQALIHP